MADTYRWNGDDSEEREQLETYLRYLNEQGFLDETDVGTLGALVERRKNPLTLDGWQRIADQLVEQGEDELASQLSPQPDSKLEVVLESLRSTSSHDAEWAVFIGAGGSKPEPTGLPMVSELLPTLWQKATETNARHLLELQEHCDALGIDNIEDLLTAIDITRSAAEKPRVRRLVQDLLVGRPGQLRSRNDALFTRAGAPMRRTPDERLQDPGLADHLQESMQMLFSLLVGMMRMAQPNKFHESLARRALRSAQLSIVTTNYDVCVERALNGAYRYGGIEDLSQDTTSVLKLHGSLNWFACSSCDEVVAAGLEDIEALTRARLFPVVSQCPECNATAPHLIVPPVGNKIAEHPVLLEVRQQTESALRRAPVVAFVGYSFSEADEYVLKMVSRAVAASATKIIVFDTDVESVQRLAAFLAAHARGYDLDQNLYFVKGDAAKTFPDFVSGCEDAELQPAQATLSADGVVD